MKSIELSSRRRGEVALAAAAAAIAVILYGAYGDPDPKSEQQAVVPFLIIGVALTAMFVFGWMVPKASATGADPTQAKTGRRALAFSLVGLFLVPAAFWSGLPIVVGAAGVLVGLQIRQSERVLYQQPPGVQPL